MGQQGGSIRKGVCCQAWLYEFEPQNPHNTVGQKGLLQVVLWLQHPCCVVFTHIHMHACTHTEEINNKWKYFEKSRKLKYHTCIIY